MSEINEPWLTAKRMADHPTAPPKLCECGHPQLRISSSEQGHYFSDRIMDTPCQASDCACIGYRPAPESKATRKLDDNGKPYAIDLEEYLDLKYPNGELDEDENNLKPKPRTEDELNARDAALTAIAKQYAGAKEATFFATAGALDGWDAAIRWMKGESK